MLTVWNMPKTLHTTVGCIKFKILHLQQTWCKADANTYALYFPTVQYSYIPTLQLYLATERNSRVNPPYLSHERPNAV